VYAAPADDGGIAPIDFSAYDLDGDCYVDVVAIVHQGGGEEASGTATDIWSHRWNLFWANYYGDGTGVFTTNDAAACGSLNHYKVALEQRGRVVSP
jgi:M6 family metalloprotease-like protein